MEKEKIILVKELLNTDHIATVSAAARLIEAIGSSKNIKLDFFGISGVEEPFLQELLVNWRKNNPFVMIHIVNACDEVENIIHKAFKTR